MSATSAIAQRPLAFLLRYVRRRPWHFGGLLLLIMSGATCAVAVQYAMKLLIDAMAQPDHVQAPVWAPLMLFLGLIGLENVFWRLGGWLGWRAIVATGVDLRLDLFQHLTGHPMRYFAQHFSGALGNRITATANATTMIFASLTWSVVPPFTDFLGAAVVMAAIHWPMAAALAGFVVFVAGAILRVGASGRGLHHAYAEQSSRVGGEVVDVVSNVWTVKAFSARERERRRLEREFGVEAGSHLRALMYVERTRVLHDLCLWLMAGSMLVWAILLWRKGSITEGDVVIVSALSFRILHGSRDLALALLNTAQHFGAIADTLGVIAQPHTVADKPDARPLQARGGAIDIDGIGFRHADGREVFRHFSLRIPAGQKLGIVGPSGAGKSTLINLIQRLDDVQSGRILIDGQDIGDLQQDSLRARVAVVPQEIALFHRSILENIRYGRPEARVEEVLAAARAAYCEGFVRELPQGYDTLVGERGVMLSGGQRQRLGLARAFLKDAPILILDEATSALDTLSESEIQQALSELVRGRTVLAVAHRLSTVSAMDRIVVLVDGRIVEDGSPEQLRRSGGVFDALWNLQADGFAGRPSGARERMRARLASR